MLSQTIALFLIFTEAGFPAGDLAGPLPFPADDQVVAAGSVTELIAEMRPDRILVWCHGGAFPAEAWPALIDFLESGGRLLHLGGEPFTRPVTGRAGARVMQPRTVSLLKELDLNRSYRVACAGARQVWRAATGEAHQPAAVTLPAGTWVSVLEPRLSNTKRVAAEDGSDGPREAILRPLAFIHLSGDDERFPAAAGAVAIDRLAGRFAGGRWIFRLLSSAPAADEVARLRREAVLPVTDSRLEVRYGCFHAGEEPAVTLRLVQPGKSEERDVRVQLTLTDPDGKIGHQRDLVVRAGADETAEVSFPGLTAPGLYALRAVIEGFQAAETGFWIMDDELFASGDSLSFDSYTLTRNGMPEPVLGSTVMSATVHRQFLFEPDALVWDRTFAEMAALDLNVTRTGVWTGFDRIMSNTGDVDEAWLRALEAYYLTARRHGIPVIFTFFAFVPPVWGGVSPYFDPVSIAAQQRYITAVATRFAGAREMMWDLINEPSFASPDKLWRCRPHGDRHEEAAFRRWLQARFGGDGAGGGGGAGSDGAGGRDPGDSDPGDSDPGDHDATWQDVVRARWRLLPGEEIGLPEDSDFDDHYYFSNHRPYGARDWLHFAQDAFTDWIDQMTEAIHVAGSAAPITVGQDEGGLVQRPSPLFHHHAVDYTSMHTWWNNSDLLWDGIMAKAPGKALLVSETGIMQRELLSGESLRDLQGYADLLSRKIGYAFAAGAGGVIEWVYDVNPYMPSDNEVAIGLRRADGSYKPEHRTMRDFAAFLRRNREHFRGLKEPDVAMVVPFNGFFGPRALEVGATRQVVSALVATGGERVQAVAEYRTGEDLGTPCLIILPSTRGISIAAWRDILSAVDAGAVLHCSGWFENDDAGLPAHRLGGRRRPLALVETGRSATSEVDLLLHFPLAAVESGFAADHDEMPLIRDHGDGLIRHFAYPLDWASNTQVGEYYLAESLGVAKRGTDAEEAGGADSGGDSGADSGAAPSADQHPGLVIYRLRFAAADLLVAINESAVERRAILWRDLPAGRHDRHDTDDRHDLHEITVPPGVSRMLLVDRDGRIIDSSHDMAVSEVSR